MSDKNPSWNAGVVIEFSDRPVMRGWCCEKSHRSWERAMICGSRLVRQWIPQGNTKVDRVNVRSFQCRPQRTDLDPV